jgi:hypothetical protein
MQNYDFKTVENKYGKLTKSLKSRCIRAIENGKHVKYVPDFNKPPKEMAHYLNNLVVYTDINDRSKIIRYYSNPNANAKTRNQDEGFSIVKPIRVSNRDQAHLLGRRWGRVISKREILLCLSHGIQVKNFSKVTNNDGSPYVYYDRYYFYDDVAVIAAETKNYINIRTVYRTQGPGDVGFIDLVPGIISQLKLSEESTSIFSIVNNSARLKYLQSDEHAEMLVLARTLAGKNHFIQNKKLEDFRDKVYKNGIWEQVQTAAKLKAVELGDIRYNIIDSDNSLENFHSTFSLNPTQSYSIVFTFETHDNEKISKRQKTVLTEYGLDIEKYSSQVEHTTNDQKNLVSVVFDIAKFCAPEHPWAIRRNNNNIF